MLYYYILNDDGKVAALLKQQPEGENFPTIELENPYIELGANKVVDGKLVYVGLEYNQEIIDQQEKQEKLHKIKKLKKLLEQSDWKVIVNSELVAAGLDPKYPNLHVERQAWRDEINNIEVDILSLGVE
jgi:hypothetical protein